MEQKTINWIDSYRDEFPNTYPSFASYEDILYDLTKKGIIPDEYNDEEEMEKHSFVPKKSKDKPPDLNGMAILIKNLEEYIPDYKIAHAAYVKSLTGQASELYYGEKPFSIKLDDLSTAEDLLSTAMSFFMPLDWLVL